MLRPADAPRPLPFVPGGGWLGLRSMLIGFTQAGAAAPLLPAGASMEGDGTWFESAAAVDRYANLTLSGCFKLDKLCPPEQVVSRLVFWIRAYAQCEANSEFLP